LGTGLEDRQNASRGHGIKEGLRGNGLLDGVLENLTHVFRNTCRTVDTAPGTEGEVKADFLGRRDTRELRVRLVSKDGEDLQGAVSKRSCRLASTSGHCVNVATQSGGNSRSATVKRNADQLGAGHVGKREGGGGKGRGSAGVGNRDFLFLASLD